MLRCFPVILGSLQRVGPSILVNQTVSWSYWLVPAYSSSPAVTCIFPQLLSAKLLGEASQLLSGMWTPRALSMPRELPPDTPTDHPWLAAVGMPCSALQEKSLEKKGLSLSNLLLKMNLFWDDYWFTCNCKISYWEISLRGFHWHHWWDSGLVTTGWGWRSWPFTGPPSTPTSAWKGMACFFTLWWKSILFAGLLLVWVVFFCGVWPK